MYGRDDDLTTKLNIMSKVLQELEQLVGRSIPN